MTDDKAQTDAPEENGALGKPSQAEGGDPETDDQEVEVLPEAPGGTV